MQLKASNIHKRFGEIEVLRGIDLEARRGDVIALIGASGSGKSTFLRCLNLLETPDQGDIFLQGEKLEMTMKRGQRIAADRKQLQRLRARMGFVFQSFNLWSHMTVIENVIEGPAHVLGVPKAAARERAQALLDKVGVGAHADKYPARLSGGQQQRVAIARALAMEPEVMLFDEPTSALDPELVGEVLKVIRSLAEEGRTMLLVTHEMAFARDVASQIIFLHEGRIEEQGPPSQIFSAAKSPRLQGFLSSTQR